MKLGTFFAGVVALVAINGISGCFGSRPSVESGTAQGQPVEAGEAHRADTSWSPSGTSWSGARKAEVKDPGDGMTAFTVDVPQGWKFEGTILRPAGCHAPATPADGLSYMTVAPDGVTGVGQVPGVSWSWASDGTSPLGPKCKPVNISTAAGFLLNIAVPMMHPEAKIVGIVPLSDKMQANLNAARQRMQGQGPTHVILDSARVKVEYQANGKPVEELLGVAMTCRVTEFPAYPAMRRPARTVRSCDTHGTYVKRAPKGKLEALIAADPTMAQIDTQWDADISRKMQQSFAAYKQASDAQFAAIQQHYKEVTAGMVARGQQFNENLKQSTDNAMAADRARQGAIDHAAHLQVLDSLNRADFIDPTTGQKIETSNQFNHSWISTDGTTAVLNADPTFDPNGVVDPGRESFVELIPAN